MTKDDISQWLRVRGWNILKPKTEISGTKKRKIYRIQHSFPLKFHHVALRLTSEATKFLQKRIQDAIKRKVGVNLILADLDGAIAFVHSRKRPEIVISAYSGSCEKIIKSHMRGYRGRWNHVELYADPSLVKTLTKFLEVLE